MTQNIQSKQRMLPNKNLFFGISEKKRKTALYSYRLPPDRYLKNISLSRYYNRS